MTATPTDARQPDSAGPGGRDRGRTLFAVIGAAVVLAVGALLVVGLLNRDSVDNSIDKAIARGERIPAPAFTLPVLVPGPGTGARGTPLSLADLRGRVVVLNFWASWCEPCVQEAPLLESVWRRYRARGVVVLGVNSRDVEADALGFTRTYALRFPVVRDGEGGVSGRYGTRLMPETFIIDRRGRVAGAMRGALVSKGDDANLEAFRKVLDTVVAEPEA